ncbi:hypothetical protein LWF15_03790 [Kineosporia rhizophila]|uniref:hypothetical protein n=1 Tax=Kineosporia TaxID=49184 RepID=UPI001E639C94|nr:MULTISPECIES: hypothetical protein [Kineosporia]MCE0534621.1 hypothetical protein [Kineosporia rhizophila]
MSLILTAVVAGESKTETNTMIGAVEDDYGKLHSALQARLEGRPDALEALQQYVDQPENDKDTLITGLQQAGVTHDSEVLELALKVMQRIDPEGSANGNYAVDRS